MDGLERWRRVIKSQSEYLKIDSKRYEEQSEQEILLLQVCVTGNTGMRKWRHQNRWHVGIIDFLDVDIYHVLNLVECRVRRVI